MRVLSQVEVEEKICQVMEAMESRTEDYDRLSIAAANAEADYRRHRALSVLAVVNSERKMTVDEREARADAASADEHRTYLTSVAVRNSCRESLQSLREQLNALRTLAANIRQVT